MSSPRSPGASHVRPHATANLGGAADRIHLLFQARSYLTFQWLMLGWVQCQGRRTLTEVALASGAVGERHISVFTASSATPPGRPFPEEVALIARAQVDDATGRLLVTSHMSENLRLLGPVWFCYSAAPPSTISVEPVIMAASSETTKRNAFAMSSGVWSRPSGVAARRRS